MSECPSCTAVSETNDLKRYSLLTRKLRSPVLGQQWLLAWGALSGHNGMNRFRIRIYAFDSKVFHTIWSPEDELNVKIIMTGKGLSVEHLDAEHFYVTRKPPFTLRDDYRLTAKGPQKIASYHLPE